MHNAYCARKWYAGSWQFFSIVPLLFWWAFETPKPKIQPAFLPVDDVQVTVPGNFTPPFEFLNNIPNNGLDLNDDGIKDIIPSCSCRSLPPIQNGTFSNAGVFDDQIIVATGVSGQAWRLQNASNVLNPSTLQSILPGTNIPEIGNTGIYVLKMAHREGVGYYAYVESPVSYPGQAFGPVVNTCYYPDPYIPDVDEAYCDTHPNVVLFGEATSAFDGNIFPLTPASETYSITRTQDNVTYFTQVFSPNQLGGGNYTIRYTFDAGSRPDTAANKTGCSVTVQEGTYVQSSSLAISCISGINVTLSPNTCQVNVIPELLLSNPPSYLGFFHTEVLTSNGVSLGSVIPAQYAGQILLGVVHDECSGLYCTTNINVKDLSAPVLNAPPDITIPCYSATDPSVTGTATATDCTNVTITYTDQWQQNQCGNPRARIFRTWKAVDIAGNMKTKLQTITIQRGNQSQLIFPPDVTYSCEEYQADPTITNAAADKAGLPNLVTESLCSMIYSYLDDTLFICGDPQLSFAILRTWLVLDVCGSTTFQTDGQGNDNLQIIRVLDDTPPVVETEPITLGTTEPMQSSPTGTCTSRGFIPPPVVTDACNVATVRIYTPIGELDYINGMNGNQGGYIPAPGLQPGVHTITYVATDACGNSQTYTTALTVEDQLPPEMICDISINVTLSSQGYGRILAADIDEGSRDDCCLDQLLIKLEDEPDSMFRTQIDFYCTNDTVIVILRAIDCNGNFNECEAQAVVRDNAPPHVVSNVTDVQVLCTDDFSSYYQEDFNAPLFTDNCGVDIAFDLQEDLNPCGIGTITRTWTATDAGHNTPAVVTQHITILPEHAYVLVVPSDNTVACDDLYFPEFTNQSTLCDSIEVYVTQQIFTEPDQIGCYRVRRIHHVVNRCEYDGVSAPFELPRLDGPDQGMETGDQYTIRSDGHRIFRVGLGGETDLGPSTGYYQYEQIIDVVDDSPPAIAFDTLPAVCITSGDCVGQISYSFSLSDNCGGEFTVINSLNLNNEGIITDIYGTLEELGDGHYSIIGEYPVGHHSLQISAFDACDNLSQFLLPFTVEDCSPPEINCPQDLTFELPDENGILLVPDDIVQVESNCSPVELSFSEDGTINELAFNCDTLGPQTITIWATNESGQVTSCTANIQITAEISLCSEVWNIDGEVKTETGNGIANTNVELAGPVLDNQLTDLNGNYLFSDIPTGNGYKVEPGKDNNHRNGVTTLDLIFITRHILGIQLLNSPYKIIAADANRSGTVSTQDVIAIRRLILTLDSAFVNNTSWRFIPEDYVFSDSLHPLVENFPESKIIETLSSDTTVNFIGVKIGDVNNSANSSDLTTLEERNSDEVFLMTTPARRLTKGELVKIPFTGSQPVNGFQMELKWDPSKLTWLEIPPSSHIDASYFGVNNAATGKLAVSWNAKQEPECPEMELIFRVEEDGMLEDMLWVGRNALGSEAYVLHPVANAEIRDIALAFTSKMMESNSMQIIPNPFSTNTHVIFSLEKAQTVQIDIFNSEGKLLYTHKRGYNAGQNAWRIDSDMLPATGILYCRLQCANFSDVKKILILKK